MNRRARHAKSAVMLGLTYVAAVVATLPLVLVLFYLIKGLLWIIIPALIAKRCM